VNDARHGDPRALRNALGCFATGVTVITARSPDGQLIGFTANSFNSVSLDPPLVLFSLDRKAQSLRGFQMSTHFAVNILARDQRALSNQFARATDDKFAGVAFTRWDSGAPILEGAIASFECRLRDMHAGGDHVIFVGQVERMAAREDGEPLLYFRGSYATLAKS
jgi:flavin reductase (DIM6/NTAB) family NADH-FMN oxidoreductase RutF